MSDFEKMFAPEKSRFGSFHTVKTTYSPFCVSFYKAWIRIEKFITCQFLNWKKYNASDSELQKYNASDFEFKETQRVIFWF